MQIVLGPFHPHLEDALVEEILRYKNNAPLAPLLILVPSDSLRRRVKVLLARERGLNFLNLHAFTFFQLSLRLVEERYGAAAPPSDNALLEEILRQIIRQGLPGAAPFAALEDKAGGAAALWQTLRDLKDGAVDPEVVLEAVGNNLFEETNESAGQLFTLFQTLIAGCAQWNLRDYADLDRLALEEVPVSQYLKQFERVLYYGFYDLTQVQLDLFQSVARRYPTTLFFPLAREKPKAPAWIFAERFYERYVHGMADAESETRNLIARGETGFSGSLPPLFADDADAPRRATPDGFFVATFSCFDAAAEIDAAAKEILRLAAEEAYAFDDIGVVGRTLEPYLPWLKESFAKHAIPMTTSAEEALVRHPLAKAALLLVNLPLKGYLRAHLIDLVDSPFFRGAPTAAIAPRPDLWDLATRRLGIGKGIADWRRLEEYIARDSALAAGAGDEDEPKKIFVPADQLRLLWKIFSDIFADLNSLPAEASWRRYVELWRTLQNKWLRLNAAHNAVDDAVDVAVDGADENAPVAEAIAATLDRLAALDAVGAPTSLRHFLETYQRGLGRAALPAPDANFRGVQVLDAMAARGVPFRALFVLGMNEGLFPRTIREDAFLGDCERALLETALGYKVAAKLGGFDEERLLFTLLAGAAREKLYCLYSRNDEGARPLAPSWYLDELGRAADAEKIQTIFVPRGEMEKSALAPFDRVERLPPEELAIRLILTAREPQPLVDRCLPAPSLYGRGREAIRHLETIADALAERDGVVGALPAYWARLAADGISPTALETYARCPFQFFARHLLGLERLERPEVSPAPDAADAGEIVHAILKIFYQELLDRPSAIREPHGGEQSRTTGSGQASLISSEQATAALGAAAQRVFRAFERDHPVGYPLAWENLQEDLVALLEQAVARDLAELSASGYAPRALESEATARLPESWPAPLGGLLIRGRIDRIDYQPKENRFRMVDYKLKSAPAPAPDDRNLLRAAVRGKRLQPPFYLRLGKTQAEALRTADAAIDAAFYYLAPQWAGGPLVVERMAGDAWEGPSGAALKQTVAFLAESIRLGLFFIQPDDYCRYCEVSEACRRNHRPTMWRVERDPRSKTHKALRKKETE